MPDDLTAAQVRALRVLAETPLVGWTDSSRQWVERADNERRTRIGFADLGVLVRARLIEPYSLPLWRWRINAAGRAELARREAAEAGRG